MRRLQPVLAIADDAESVDAAEFCGIGRQDRDSELQAGAADPLEAATELVGRRAGELMCRYRRSPGGIGLGDYLIAATADVNGLELATLNTRHFPMFPGLEPPFALA